LNDSGFILTFDSFLGVVLLFFLFLASFFYISQVNFDSWNSIDLITLARDELTVLEKNKVFENAILGNSSELIRQNINSAPNPICFEASIFEDNDITSPVIIATKTGCDKVAESVFAVNRTIVVNNNDDINFYLVKMEAWYK
jgi:hypothetical protein